MLEKSNPGRKNPDFHITLADCIDCLLNYRQSYLFGIKWLTGTSEALKNRCKMGEDQTNRTVQAMCKVDLFAPSISTKLIGIIVTVKRNDKDDM